MGDLIKRGELAESDMPLIPEGWATVSATNAAVSFEFLGRCDDAFIAPLCLDVHIETYDGFGGMDHMRDTARCGTVDVLVLVRERQ